VIYLVGKIDENYIVRNYREGDAENIVELLKQIFGKWPPFKIDSTAMDYFKWKYFDNPVLGPNDRINFVSEYQGKIVGTTNGVLLKVKIGDTITILHNGTDGAVKAEHRRKGLNKKAWELRFETLERLGVTFFLSSSGNPILQERNKRRGYLSFPGEIVIYQKINNVNEFLEPRDASMVKKIGFRSLNYIMKLKKILFGVPKLSYRVEEWTEFDESINILWNNFEKNHTYCIERKMEYLNWRYCDPNGGIFKVRGIKKDGQPLGFCVLAINENQYGQQDGVIVDLVAVRPDVIETLVLDAIVYFNENRVNRIKMMNVKKHPISKILSKNGFLDIGTRSYAAFQQINDVSENLLKMMNSSPSQLHIVYGDQDFL
jgi:hypothetical protein